MNDHTLYVATIPHERGNAHIFRSPSGKSFVIEIWRTTPRQMRVDTRRKRSRESAETEARRLLDYWCNPLPLPSESSYT